MTDWDRRHVSPNSLSVGVLAVVPSSRDLQKVVPRGRRAAVPEQCSLRSSQPSENLEIQESGNPEIWKITKISGWQSVMAEMFAGSYVGKDLSPFLQLFLTFFFSPETCKIYILPLVAQYVWGLRWDHVGRTCLR